MRTLLMLPLLALTLIAEDARIVLMKEFPNSQPAYVKVILDSTGAVSYQDRPDEDQPLRFQLDPAEVKEIYTLAEKLNWFSRELEAPMKVAFMGTKTFRVEGKGPAKEVKFNYSQDADAIALQEWFERINESSQDYYFLERTVKFDKLGVNKALLQLQTTLEKKRLVGRQAFLPLLDRVAKNSSYLNMSRDRARFLAELFRGAPPAAPAKEGAPKDGQGKAAAAQDPKGNQ